MSLLVFFCWELRAKSREQEADFCLCKVLRISGYFGPFRKSELRKIPQDLGKISQDLVFPSSDLGNGCKRWAENRKGCLAARPHGDSTV